MRSSACCRACDRVKCLGLRMLLPFEQLEVCGRASL